MTTSDDRKFRECRVCGRRLELHDGVVRLHPVLATGEACPGGMQVDHPWFKKTPPKLVE